MNEEEGGYYGDTLPHKIFKFEINVMLPWTLNSVMADFHSTVSFWFWLWICRRLKRVQAYSPHPGRHCDVYEDLKLILELQNMTMTLLPSSPWGYRTANSFSGGFCCRAFLAYFTEVTCQSSVVSSVLYLWFSICSKVLTLSLYLF